jgi:putative spermidine/putrescine transport system substrate-binding protein
MTSGVRDKAAAEKWVNFLLQKQVSSQLSERTGFGNTVVASPSANDGDKLVWLDSVEDPLKRSDLWNDVKAAP